MTLHPAAQALVDQAAESGAPPLEDLPLDEARARSAQLVEALGGPVVGMAAVEDVDAGRLLTPPGAGDGTPVLVDVHGGGFVLGSVAEQERLSRRRAAAAGVRVLVARYRLAPEHPYPAALDDVCGALREAAGLGVPFAVCGDSAGGNLAAAACLRLRDEGAPLPAMQVLVCPVLDARCATPSYANLATGYLLTAATMRWFWARYAAPDPTSPYVSPVCAGDLAGLPPALVVTAEYDPLRDEGERYGELLRAAGVDAVTSRYQGVVHGFAGLPAAFPQAGDVLTEMAEALRHALSSSPSSS